MERLICMNARRSPNKGLATQQPLENYDSLTREPWLRDMVKAIREGDEKLKDELPLRCPHYRSFKDDKRRQNAIIPEAFTFQTCVDIDDLSQVERAIRKARELNAAEGIWKGMLLHMDYSARRKLHIDIRMPIGMTIEETQQAYCEAIDVAYDESCTTPERFIYITDAESEIYRSEDWYAVLTDEELAARRKAFTDRGLTIDGRSGFSQQGQPPLYPQTALTDGEEYDGVPMKLIVESLAEQLGGVPGHGVRNNFHFVMAAHLSYLNSDPNWVARHLPAYGEDRKRQLKTIASACQRPKQLNIDGEVDMPDILCRAIEIARGRMKADERISESEAAKKEKNQIPRLSGLLKLLCSKVPLEYKPMVSTAVFPALSTHLNGVLFRYIDNTIAQPVFQSIQVAGMSMGKSCINTPIDYIMADIDRQDAEHIRQINEWSEEVNAKGANKDTPKRPKGLTVQHVMSDMTNASLVQLLLDAEGKPLYVRVNEIEEFDSLKASGKGDTVLKVFRLNFDGEMYGQERVSAQSVRGRAPLHMNFNASTTLFRCKQYLKRGLTDGTLSRLNFSTIRRERGAKMPVFGTYDEEFARQLQPYLDRLTQASGTVICKPAERLAHRLLDENQEFIELSDSDAYMQISYRALVIAYWKAMVLYIAEGQWSKDIERYVEWSFHEDMRCKMEFFGDDLHIEMNRENQPRNRGPRNMLDLLPLRFRREDIMAIRRAQGLDENPSSMLGKWIERQYITLDTITNEYQKTETYLNRHPQRP